MLQCCESNHDGKIDYIGFTDQFHEPSKEIGFNLAVLLTNLSEHMPNEPRYNLLTFLKYKSILMYNIYCLFKFNMWLNNSIIVLTKYRNL